MSHQTAQAATAHDSTAAVNGCTVSTVVNGSTCSVKLRRACSFDLRDPLPLSDVVAELLVQNLEVVQHKQQDLRSRYVSSDIATVPSRKGEDEHEGRGRRKGRRRGGRERRGG